MLIYNGKISLYCFLASLMVSLLLIVPRIIRFGNCVIEHAWWILPSYYVIINVFLLICFRGYAFQVVNIITTYFHNIFGTVLMLID
jgi:hypothetical protein